MSAYKISLRDAKEWLPKNPSEIAAVVARGTAQAQKHGGQNKMLDREVWCLSVGTRGFSLWRIFTLCMDDFMHRSIGSLSLCHCQSILE